MKPFEVEAQALHRLGTPFIAGVPGSGSSYEVLDACERTGIPFLHTAHEAAGAIIAGAAARRGGGIGAALSIKGPGVANLVGGIALARFENYPLITCSEAYAPDAPVGLQHKRMDQDAMLRSLVKGVFYRGAQTSVERLAHLARHEPAGPVHLNLVESQDQTDEADVAEEPRDGLERVLDAITRSQRPVVICGSALTRMRATSMDAAEVAELEVPVFTTAAGKGIVDERSSASAGVYTGAGQSLAPERRILPETDLIIGVALRNVEVLGAVPFGARYVSVDNVGPVFQRGFQPALHCCTDLAQALPRVLQALSDHRWGLDAVAAAHDGVAAHLDRDELLPAACYATLSRVPQAQLVTDSGNFTIIAEHVWRASTPAAFTGSSNGRFMGAGLPQAIGVALRDPTRPTICTIGDGGLPMFIAELRIAIQRQLPLLVVLMSDGHYGSMRARVLERGFTQTGVHLESPSWHQAIRGMGCDTIRVSDRATFEAAVETWTRAPEPLFVEAVMPDRPYLEMVKPLRG